MKELRVSSPKGVRATHSPEIPKLDIIIAFFLNMRKNRMYDLQEINYQKIKAIFSDYKNLIDANFEKKIKQNIKVLHHQYLWGACKEAQAILDKNHTTNHNLPDLIITIYHKRRSYHQANFLLLQCFENALRSTMAIITANALNQNNYDWFLQVSNQKMQKIQKDLIKKVDAIIKCRNKKANPPLHKQEFTSFDVF